MNPKTTAAHPQYAPAETRHRLSHWQALGVVAADLPPCSVAAAYARATGHPPARDRQTRIYSQAEIAAVLAELERQPSTRPAPEPPPPAPPLDPLPVIWWAALERLGLPSTRMLLLQQCELAALRPSTYARREPAELVAVVRVRANWAPMVRNRGELVANALSRTLRRPTALELLLVAEVAQ